ncbi:hypothetical protein ACI2KR_07220 [Pseudomonas luteola]
MQVEKELLEFSKTYKRPICFLLGIPERNCTDKDAAIFIDYLIGHKAPRYIEANGSLDLKFLRSLRDIPRSERDLLVLKRITAFYDRDNILKNAYNLSFDRSFPFSKLFEDHLIEQRKAKLRSYFFKLHESVNRLNVSLGSLTKILSNNASHPTELKHAIKNVRMSIQSCEFHLKSGIAMGLANGIHPHALWKASQRIYDSRASRLTKLSNRIDDIAASRGVTTSLHGFMKKRNERWMKNWRNVFEAHRINRIKNYERNIRCDGIVEVVGRI